MNGPHNLALLIAAPQPGETAMYRDQTAMAAALLARGLAAKRPLSGALVTKLRKAASCHKIMHQQLVGWFGQRRSFVYKLVTGSEWVGRR
jgi:hypothetical protein